MTDDIAVLQVASEFDRLRAVYRKARPKRVLEIGCWEGGTLREWLREGAPDIVVAVDLQHTHEKLYWGWRQEQTALHVITGASQTAPVLEQMQAYAPYDWVFIDGDHGDASVRSDVANVMPLVAPGGLMVLHDIEAGTDYTGTYPPGLVLAELDREGYRTAAYIDPARLPWAHGIGVVWM